MSGICAPVGADNAGSMVGAQVGSGNRCGHNPAAPCLTPLEPAGRNLPPIITAVIDRFERYYDSPSILPALNAVNGSTRQQRSERREALSIVFHLIMKYFNLLTGRIEIPTARNGFIGLTIDWIASKCNLGYKRVQRALADLEAAGIIEVKRRAERISESGYRGIASIKRVSTHLFRIFGLYDEFKRQQKYKQDQQAKKVQEMVDRENPAKAQRALFLKGLTNKLANGQGKRKTHFKQLQEESVAEKERERQLLMLQIKQEHPDWSLEEVRREANKQLLRGSIN